MAMMQIPEDPDDRIPDELLDDATVGLDLRSGHREVGVEHAVHVLGVGPLGGGGIPDQVAEECRDNLPLFRERRAAPSGERRTAFIAELGRFGVLCAACTAGHHGANPTTGAEPPSRPHSAAHT
jgi:hypothetical protein